MISYDMRARLGLNTFRDGLVAFTQDAHHKLRIVAYTTDDTTTTPGVVSAFDHISSAIEILTIKNKKNAQCYWINNGIGGHLWFPSSDCAPEEFIKGAPTEAYWMNQMELRPIDITMREALGLHDRDLLVAFMDDASHARVTVVVYVTDEQMAIPGALVPGTTVEKLTQLLFIRNSPLCGWIADGSGGKIYYQAPHCPHPIQK